MLWTNETHMAMGDKSSNHTQTADPSPPAKVGIAFGAGVAKGWSHIGVIKRLDEAGIVPDVIAGASIGALAGGCYAAGKIDALEKFALGLTRRRVFSLMDFSWRGSGIISGNKLAQMLQDELGDTQVEDLERPFICIGTELNTGHEIWLQKGHLVTAMRASYALPGVFKPIHFNDMWLIDGAVVNPIPVSACRAPGRQGRHCGEPELGWFRCWHGHPGARGEWQRPFGDRRCGNRRRGQNGLSSPAVRLVGARPRHHHCAGRSLQHFSGPACTVASGGRSSGRHNLTEIAEYRIVRLRQGGRMHRCRLGSSRPRALPDIEQAMQVLRTVR